MCIWKDRKFSFDLHIYTLVAASIVIYAFEPKRNIILYIFL